jgi:hypothetical protein
MFEEPSPGRFALNDVARELLNEGIRVGFDLESFGGRMAYAWGTLLSAVRAGKPAYHEHFGRDWWSDLEAHPKIAADFDLAMGPGHGPADPDVLLSGWDNVRTVADVGGGTGTQLRAVLDAHPSLQGILIDLPRTIAKADPHPRMKTVGQSFFDPLPAGLDVYLLKSVIVDWPDDEARRILQRCAETGGRVVIIGGVTPNDQPDPNLLMLVLVGGKTRTIDEFTALAHSAGLKVTGFGRNKSGRFIAECAPI